MAPSRASAHSKNYNFHQNRRQLVAPTSSKPQPAVSAVRATADQARSLQDSLQRTQTLLQQELERVSHISHSVDQDGKYLQQTKTHHLEIHDQSYQAQRALRALQRQQQQERRILYLAVTFFYLVVAYVVWTRLRIPFLLW
jgi:hypothetical protein